MTAVAEPQPVTRTEYTRAIFGADLPPLAFKAAIWLAEACRWTTGVLDVLVSGRRLAYVLGCGLREVRRAIAVLRERSLLAVVERGERGEPRYALALPGRVRQEPPRPAPEPPPEPEAPAPPEPQTYVGRMWAKVVAALCASPEAGEDLPMRARPNMRLAREDGYAPGEEPAEPEVDPMRPPPELEDFWRPRVVGPLYFSREQAAVHRARLDVERAREDWQRRQESEAAREDGPGDAAPHRAVLLAYRRAYREAYGESPWLAEIHLETFHPAVKALLTAIGLDASLAAIRKAFEGHPRRRPSLEQIAARAGAIDGAASFRIALREA